MNHTCTRLFCLAAVALVFGCSGGSGIDTVPVTGKVTYKGQPVDGARVSFIGQGSAKTATGVSGADGSYTLMTLDANGAMPGSFIVVVDKTDMPAELTKETTMEEAEKQGTTPLPQPKALLPAKYSDPAQSPLKFEVKSSGENNINLELTD